MYCHNVTCPHTCASYQNESYMCQESFDCETGCYCPYGMIEDVNGNCVQPENCTCDLSNANCNECEYGVCEEGRIVCRPQDDCDCQSQWSEWSSCNQTCGQGQRTRTRVVTSERRGNGAVCPTPNEESQNCTAGACESCEINGVTYEIGEIIAATSCQTCYCSTYLNQSCVDKDVRDQPAPVWTEWGEFTACSRTCGSGTRQRRRTCQDVCHEGVSEACAGSSVQVEPCNQQPCDSCCVMGEWEDATSCSAECDNVNAVVIGQVQQTRSILREPHGSGAECPETFRVTSCNKTCSVDCRVISYTNSTCEKRCSPNDTSCDPTCGIGMVTSTPYETIPAQNGGRSCEVIYYPCDKGECGVCAPPKQKIQCLNRCQETCSNLATLHQCVDSDCKEGCGCPENMLDQDGECVPRDQCRCTWNAAILGPRPANLTEQSVPGTVVQKECNNCTCTDGQWSCTSRTCDVDCQWTNWTPFGDCNVTCGQGYQRFTRTINVPAQYNGEECTGPDTKAEVCRADQQCCEPNTNYFSENSACEATCESLINNTVSTNCQDGCRCREGYVRADGGACIPSSECYKCRINGETWENNEQRTNFDECKIYYCEDGSLQSTNLTLDLLPPCTVSDEEGFQLGYSRKMHDSQCCYQAMIEQCHPVVDNITSIMVGGEACDLPSGASVPVYRCDGACQSTSSSRVLIGNLQNLERMKAMFTANLASIYGIYSHNCKCCSPKTVVTGEQTALTCVKNQVEITVQYLPLIIKSCSCQDVCRQP